MKIRIHTFPFFIFDMYSRPAEHSGGSTTAYEIIINGTPRRISNLSQYQQAVILGNLNFMEREQSGNLNYWEKSATKNLSFIPLNKRKLLNTPENMDLQKKWFQRYLGCVFGEKVTSVEVHKMFYKILPERNYELEKMTEIYNYQP